MSGQMRDPDAAPAQTTPLAIIAGAGSLPFTVADAVEKRGRRAVLFAIRGWADARRVAAYPHYWAAVGQFGRFCRLARQEGCRDVVMIGSVVRPALWRIKPDLATLRLLPRILALFRGGDDHLLSGIAKIFEDHGFRLVGAHEIVPEILMQEGPLGREHPRDRDRAKRPMMVRAVQDVADFAFATADNPRGEALTQIFADMKEGVTAPEKITWIDDRRRAISLALDIAKPGDCLLIAGKGHESYQEFADAIIPFDDRQIVRELIGIKTLKHEARS